MRKVRRCPPFADIFTVTVSGTEEEAVLQGACALRRALVLAAKSLKEGEPPEVLGPAPAPVLKVNNRFRYRIIWIGRNDHDTRALLSERIQAFARWKGSRGLTVFIDCNGAD